METNVRCSRWVMVYMYGGRGEFTAFSDILATISRRTYELEAFLRSGVCAAGSSIARFDAGGCADAEHRRRYGCGLGPERWSGAGREGGPEGRFQGQQPGNED